MTTIVSNTQQSDKMAETRTLSLCNPATGEPTILVPLAHEIEVDQAAQAARKALTAGWSDVPLKERALYLKKLRTLIEKRREDFAQSISKQVGSPIDFARTHQVSAALSHIDATLEAAKNIDIDVPVMADAPHHRVRYEPIGVAALITPWNWPLNQAVLKLSGALIAGCSMILKPSELTPDCSHLLADCIKETGLPDGVFNLLIGDGQTGQALTSHKDVDVISFTGSTAVGREIATHAAQTFKRTILELGGKSPNLLFADCDIEKAVRQGLAHCFRNAGQSCNAASRMLVEKSIYDDVTSYAAKVAENTEIGLPKTRGLHLGPLISKSQYDRVQGLIASGIQNGAKLFAGGLGHPEGFDHGNFVKPTVFGDVSADMPIFREEIFGPVLTITPFENEADAIALANDCDYGLAGYIQTADAERADRVAQRLKVGMVQVNGSSRAAGAAFGGTKASGHGREAGLWGIRAFQDIKSISGARSML